MITLMAVAPLVLESWTAAAQVPHIATGSDHSYWASENGPLAASFVPHPQRVGPFTRYMPGVEGFTPLEELSHTLLHQATAWLCFWYQMASNPILYGTRMASKLMSVLEGVSVPFPGSLSQFRAMPYFALGSLLKRLYSAVRTASQPGSVTPLAAPNSLKIWIHPGIM